MRNVSNAMPLVGVWDNVIFGGVASNGTAICGRSGTVLSWCYVELYFSMWNILENKRQVD